MTDLYILLCFINASEELSRLAARKYARIIQKLGFPVSGSMYMYIFFYVFTYMQYAVSHYSFLSYIIKMNSV